MKFWAMIGFRAFALAISVCPAIAQVKSGTVIFGQFTSTDIVLAADSGFIAVGGNGIVTHGAGQCKIGAFNGKILFAIAGVLNFNGRNGQKIWNLLDQARGAAAGTEISSLADLRDLADRWVERVHPLVEEAIRANPQLKDYTSNGSVVSVALFSSRDIGGNIISYITFIELIPGASKEPFTSVKTFSPAQISERAHFAVPIAVGHGSEIWQELETGASRRAKASSGLARRVRHSKSVADMERATMDLTLLAEKWVPAHAGGAIDQVHLGPTGVEWLHRKQNCAGN